MRFSETAADRPRLRTARSRSGRRVVLALAAIGLLSSACIGRLSGIAQPSGPRVGAIASVAPSVGLVAGAPISVTASTLRLSSDAGGQPLTPVAAYGNLLLVRTGSPFASSQSVSYQLWDPASGSFSAVPGWPADVAAKERLAGIAKDWLVVTRDAPPPSTGVMISLRNLKTGEVRAIGTSGDGNAAARIAVSDGWIAWVDGTPNQSGLHVYDVSSGADKILPARARGVQNLTVQNGVVAWWQGFGGQPPRIVVHDIATTKFDSIPSGPVSALALSSDGHTLIWIQGSSSSSPGLFLRDLTTGNGGRLLGGQTVGVSLSVSGPYVSWQPGPGTTAAGVYNVQTHELRLVQAAAGVSARLGRVMGPWFVWSETTSQPSPSGAGRGAAGCCYLLRLTNGP